MGVTGLWDLVAPVGRRVDVDVLATRRLAVDASIWYDYFLFDFILCRWAWVTNI